jgi:hypothetical protein
MFELKGKIGSKKLIEEGFAFAVYLQNPLQISN